MFYFVSDLRGSLNNFYNCIKRISAFKPIKENDIVYFLGNTIVGNSPSETIELLEKIYNTKNFNIVLGPNEYFHIMYYFTSEENKTDYLKELIKINKNNAEIIKYLNNLSSDKYEFFINMLAYFDLSACMNIGDEICYICCGSPQIYSEEKELNWQYAVANLKIDYNKKFNMEVLSDPISRNIIKNPALFYKSGFPIIITANGPVSEIFKTQELNYDGSYIFCKNKIISMGAEPDGESKIIAFDAAGYIEL